MYEKMLKLIAQIQRDLAKIQRALKAPEAK